MELNPNIPTQLDIGLSREDQDRIAALRQPSKPKTTPKLWLKKLSVLVSNLTRIKLQDRVTFYQLLSVMINSGVPIIRALYVLSEQDKNIRFKRVIRDLAKSMELGQSLSVAMLKHENVFSEADRGMIASGEASGNLNNILKDISKQGQKGAGIVSKVKGAMIYPAAIMIILVIALVILMTFVVPQLAGLFIGSNASLPLSTRILLGASEFTQKNWDLMGIGIVILVLGFTVFYKTKRGHYLVHEGLLHVPIFGKLIRQLILARFSRLLASLLKAGVPIVRSLEITARAMGNDVYERRIRFAAQDVAQGIPLGENMNGNEFLFPPMVTSMVLVGEQTATLSEVCIKIADYYEDRVDTIVSSLSKLMEPVILVIMGLVVSFVVAAVMQPIISLSDVTSVL